MISQHANTLYIQSDDVSLRVDHDAIAVQVAQTPPVRIPLLHLEAIVVIGVAAISSGVMERCAQGGISLVRLTRSGRVAYRVTGPDSGNVLLRMAQYRAHEDEPTSREIARAMVAGKIRNSRAIVLRAGRDSKTTASADRLHAAAMDLETMLSDLERPDSLDGIRGIEGEAARTYFEVFADMVTAKSAEFAFRTRSRRPPRDRMNALLSFVYALLVADCAAAAQAAGLDHQVGYLHALRPGRPSLALDLMEELRPVVADRLVLNLVNRGQVKGADFEVRPGGATLLRDDGRRTVITEYARRKQHVVRHRWLEEDMEFGVIPHVQARLLARVLRGDLPRYVPFVAGS